MTTTLSSISRANLSIADRAELIAVPHDLRHLTRWYWTISNEDGHTQLYDDAGWMILFSSESDARNWMQENNPHFPL